MSSADVRDMLGIGPLQQQPPKRQKTEQATKKLDGIKRELYALLGDNTPPVSIIENKFKQRPNWLEKPAPWSWVPFKVDDDDDKVFHHWVRGGVDKDGGEYSFGKFNIETKIQEFSNQEYDLGLKDPDWSFQETQYLFEKCREYDLRWIVIHDRYNFNEKQRSLDDLRDRYYKVTRKLMEIQRDLSGLLWSDKQQEYYNSINFIKDKEITRKKYLENLYSRSPQEIAEEEMLINESKRLELSSKKMQFERQELLKLLDSPVASGSISQHETSQGLAMFTSNMLMADKSRKRRALDTSTSTPPPATATAAAASSPSPSSTSSPQQQSSSHIHQRSLTPQPSNNKRQIALSQSQSYISKFISPGNELNYGLYWNNNNNDHHHRQFSSPGVFIRSSKLSNLKPSIQPKIIHILAELGLPKQPIMSTACVCEKFNHLQQAISLMLDLKRQVDKQQADYKLLKSTQE